MGTPFAAGDRRLAERGEGIRPRRFVAGQLSGQEFGIGDVLVAQEAPEIVAVATTSNVTQAWS